FKGGWGGSTMLNEANFLPFLPKKTTIYQQYNTVEINVVATLQVIDPPQPPLKRGEKSVALKKRRRVLGGENYAK
ncbi:MAG: hypothetical protein ACK5JB_07310, partial [Pseudanabaena sp.]